MKPVTYRYAARENNEDLSPGGALFSAPGFPAFPVRLATEMFQRAVIAVGGGPVVVWDPCCGSGYLLTAVSLTHREAITAVVASDIDAAALALARRNLDLLSEGGLAARSAELLDRARRYGKPSYVRAADAAGRLHERLAAGGGPLPFSVARADVFDSEQLRRVPVGGGQLIVMTDVPYGDQTQWHGANATAGMSGMLDALAGVLDDEAVIVVAGRGRRLPAPESVTRLQSFSVGRRAIALFRPRVPPRASE